MCKEARRSSRPPKYTQITFCKLRYEGSHSAECMPLIACRLPSDLPANLLADCPQFARIFAYGAVGPAFDADYLERSQSQDPVHCRLIKKVWYDIYHFFVSYQLTRNSR